jgi:hypothetical protein
MKNPKHGGAQEESRLIKKYADEWCKANGYPLQPRQYVYKKLYKKIPIPKREGGNR